MSDGSWIDRREVPGRPEPRTAGRLGARTGLPRHSGVRNLGLERADDRKLWDHARSHSLTLLSKDADFRQLSFLHGHPPKVVWLDVGNCSTDRAIATLLAHRQALEAFAADEEAALLRLA